MRPFGTYEPTAIISRIKRHVSTDAWCSVRFYATVAPLRSIDQSALWRQFKDIVGCQAVYDALGTIHGPIDRPSDIAYGSCCATIGMLANFLLDGCAQGRFANDLDDAMDTARCCLDNMLGRDYGGAEAFQLDCAWSDWFVGERSDYSFLLGQRNAWWLLASTDTD